MAMIYNLGSFFLILGEVYLGNVIVCMLYHVRGMWFVREINSYQNCALFQLFSYVIYLIAIYMTSISYELDSV